MLILALSFCYKLEPFAGCTYDIIRSCYILQAQLNEQSFNLKTFDVVDHFISFLLADRESHLGSNARGKRSEIMDLEDRK